MKTTVTKEQLRAAAARLSRQGTLSTGPEDSLVEQQERCPHCNAVLVCVDLCDECGEEFGESGEDANGHNCTCTACKKSNMWTTCCSACGEAVDED